MPEKKFQGEEKRKNRRTYTFLKNSWIRTICVITLPFLLLVLYFPSRILLTRIQSPEPQLIFVLGGVTDRESFTASYFRNYPNLDIWVSSGSPVAEKIFQEAGIPDSRVHLDCRATDTVTNFTTVVDDLKIRNINHVYLVTSEYHMLRSIAIGSIVFGSQGITFTPVVSPTNRRYPEVNGETRIFRDMTRSLYWLLTGKTGESFNGRSQEDFCKNPGYQRGIQKK